MYKCENVIQTSVKVTGKVSVIVSGGWEIVTDKNSVNVTGIRGKGESVVTVLNCCQYKNDS